MGRILFGTPSLPRVFARCFGNGGPNFVFCDCMMGEDLLWVCVTPDLIRCDAMQFDRWDDCLSDAMIENTVWAQAPPGPFFFFFFLFMFNVYVQPCGL